jgi:RNA polymerase sigma-70 factor (ECF subfamily)
MRPSHEPETADGGPEIDDAELVAAALGGSEEAFHQIVERFQRPVFSLIARMVGDPATAEDLAQETFLKAFRRLATYDPERRFSSWLFKIAHNTTLDHLRRRGPQTVTLEPEDEEGGGLAAVLADDSLRSPETAAQRGDLAAALGAAVGALRPEYREIVLLRYQEGLAYQEIAEVAGLPLGTVKTHLHRARKELIAALAAAGWGPEGIAG